jgi:teichuronic acid biosynthesis glycosyltransferase TuaG
MGNKKGTPLVTVVVTTYNRKELLKETIDSILNQTYTNFELIVVDNFSNYDFLKHVKSFEDKRIIAFQNQNNGIIAVNRNFGIKRANGDYIAFCDDDDLWLPNKLETQIRNFDKSLVGVGTEINLINISSAIVERRQGAKNMLLSFVDIIQFRSLPLSSLLIRNIGVLFDESKSLIAVEDFDFQLQLTLKSNNPILKLRTALVNYRIDTQNRNSGLQQKKNSLLIIKRYENYLSTSIKRSIYQWGFYRIGKIESLKRNYRSARSYFFMSIKMVSLKNSKLLKSFMGLILSTYYLLLKTNK